MHMNFSSFDTIESNQTQHDWCFRNIFSCLRRRWTNSGQAHQPNSELVPKPSKESMELSLLDTIESWAQVRPITTEVIRRLFPKGKFIVVNGGHELSQPVLDKLQSMICELSERKYNPSHNQKKFVTAGRELPEGKNMLTITDSTSLDTEREETVTDYRSILLCVASKDVHERELRELFCLTSTTSEEPLLIIACYCSALSSGEISCYICFQQSPLTERDWLRTKSFGEKMLSTMVRIRCQMPVFPSMGGYNYSGLRQIHGRQSDAHMKPKFRETVQLICKVIAESCMADLAFLLFRSRQTTVFTCPATSECCFSSAIPIETKEHLKNRNLLDGSVQFISDRTELETIRTLLVDPHFRPNRRWESLSLFTVRKPEEAAKCKANGGIGYVDLDCACGDQWDSSLVVVGIVQYNSSKSDATSRSSFTDDVKRRLETEWSTLEEFLTTGRSDNHRGADLMTSWKHKFHVISSSLVLWHVSPATILETMFTMIRCVLEFDSCSIFKYDPVEDVWIAQLYNYPTEKQMRVAHSWKNVPEIFSPLFPSDEPITQDTDPKHLMGKLNQMHKNTYWLLLQSDSSDNKAIVQFTSQEDFSEAQRCSIEQDLSSLCSTAVQWHAFLREKEVVGSRKEVLDELLTYHMKISDDAVLALREGYKQFDVNCPKDYDTFGYFARGLPIEQSVKAVVSMFVRLKFVEHWRIPSSTLARFVLAIQRSYRNPSYHNWTHAFCVGHFAYLCMINAQQRIHEFLSPLELLALLVGTLCHDIDHRGLNNSFQQVTNSPLSSLYGMYGSVLERHHVEHTMRIIQTENCNIFCNLSPEDEKRALRLVRQVILATDLEAHVKLLPKIRQMSRDGYDSLNEEHRHMLLSLVATASDLSDQCKSWLNSRKAAGLIYDEFFHQGELERSVGKEPPNYMDPQKVCIPESQIVFLDSIVLPCFQTLSKLLPECCEAVHSIQANRHKWKHLTKLVATNQLPGYSTERLFAGQYDAIAMTK